MQDTNKSPKVILNGEIKYVRSDLVDRLVEALKICLAGNGYEFDDRPAEAALKKLEEE